MYFGTPYSSIYIKVRIFPKKFINYKNTSHFELLCSIALITPPSWVKVCITHCKSVRQGWRLTVYSDTENIHQWNLQLSPTASPPPPINVYTRFKEFISTVHLHPRFSCSKHIVSLSLFEMKMHPLLSFCQKNGQKKTVFQIDVSFIYYTNFTVLFFFCISVIIANST